ERRLHVAVVVRCHERCGFLDEFRELAAELRDVRVTGLEDLVDLRDVQEGEQQVLDGHELMPPLPGVLECLVQAEFEFRAQHDRKTNTNLRTAGAGTGPGCFLKTLPSCTARGAAAAARSW